jgi:hypothetical protein
VADTTTKVREALISVIATARTATPTPFVRELADALGVRASAPTPEIADALLSVPARERPRPFPNPDAEDFFGDEDDEAEGTMPTPPTHAGQLDEWMGEALRYLFPNAAKSDEGHWFDSMGRELAGGARAALYTHPAPSAPEPLVTEAMVEAARAVMKRDYGDRVLFAPSTLRDALRAALATRGPTDA